MVSLRSVFACLFVAPGIGLLLGRLPTITLADTANTSNITLADDLFVLNGCVYDNTGSIDFAFAELFVGESTFSNAGSAFNIGFIDISMNAALDNVGSMSSFGSAFDLGSRYEGQVGSELALNFQLLFINDSVFNNEGLVSDASDIFLFNQGQLTNNGTLSLHNDFLIFSEGRYQGSGRLEVNDVDLSIDAGRFENAGDVVEMGNIIASASSVLVNSGTMETRQIALEESSVVSNEASGVLDMRGHSLFATDATVMNAGIIQNVADVFFVGSDLRNSGTIRSQGDVSFEGEAEYRGDVGSVLDLGGQNLEVGDGAVFENAGGVLNTGNIILLAGSRFENSGNIELGGDFVLNEGSSYESVSTALLDLNGNDLLIDGATFSDAGRVVGVETIHLLNDGNLRVHDGFDPVSALRIENGGVSDMQLLEVDTIAVTAGGVARLEGTGTAVSSSVLNQGDLTFSSSTTGIRVETSRFQQTPDAVLRLELDTRDGAANALTVTGEAALAGALVLSLRPGGRGLLLNQKEVVLSANRLLGNFDSIMADPALFELPTLAAGFVFNHNYLAGELEVTMGRDFEHERLSVFLDENQQRVGRMLNSTFSDETFLSADADMEVVLTELDALAVVSSFDDDVSIRNAATAMAEAYDEIAPLSLAVSHALSTGAARAVSGHVQRYVRKLKEAGGFGQKLKSLVRAVERDGNYYDALAKKILSSPNAFTYDPRTQRYSFQENEYRFGRKFNIGTFVSGSFQEGSVEQRVGVSGFAFDSYEFATGFDLALGERWIAGLMLSAYRGDALLDLERGQLELESQGVGVFAAYQGEYHLFNMGMHFYDLQTEQKRRVAFGNLQREAQASIEGEQWGAFVGGAWPVWIRRDVSIGGSWNLHYVHLEQDAYREKGAGSLDLAVEKDSEGALYLEWGGYFRFADNGGKGRYDVTLSGGFESDLLQDETGTEARLFRVSGAESFVNQSESIGQHRMRFGLDVGWRLMELSRLSLRYQYAHGLSGAGLRLHQWGLDFDWHY